jgi:hypothetical protein
VHYLGRLGKCCVGAQNLHKVLGLVRGTSGWCVVCIGKGWKMRLWWCVKGQMVDVNYEVD